MLCSVECLVWYLLVRSMDYGGLKKPFPHQRKLIIMDIFAIHKDNVNMIESDKDIIKLLVLTANSTQLLQPLDISVNNLVKQNLC